MVIEEQEIEGEGLPSRYLAAGEGPPVLLLHGVGDNALNWQWMMPALAHPSGLRAGPARLRW